MKKLSLGHFFLFFLTSFLIGVFIQENLSFLNFYWLIFVFISILFVFIFKLQKKILIILIINLGLIAGNFWIYYQNQKTENALQSYENQEIIAQGVAYNFSDWGTKSIFFVNLAKIKDQKTSSKIAVISYEQKYAIMENPKLEISGKLEKIPKDDFLYSWAKKEEIRYVIKKSEIEFIHNINQEKFWLQKIYFKIQENLITFRKLASRKISQTLPEPEASFLDGIILGSKQNMTQKMLDEFSATGTSHLIALSGFNITIIVYFFLSILKSWPRKLTFFIIIAGILSFVIMTGASASIVRAALMGTILLIAERFGRIAEASIAMCLAAFLIVLFSPAAIRFDVGFQLSFLATVGIIYISPLIHHFIFEKKYKKFPEVLQEAFSGTISAQIMVFPILIFNFEKISIVSPLVNLIVVPIVPIAMFFGFIQILISFIWAGLGQAIGWFTWLILKITLEIIQFFARIPLAQIEIKQMSPILIALFYVGIILLIIYFNKKKKKDEKQNL